MDNKLDVSAKEDLTQAVLHLLGVEHHAVMSYAQSGNKNTEWLELKNEVRKIRTKYLSKLVKENKEQNWCIGKHLLSASLGLEEVATRLNSEGKIEEAKEVYEDSSTLLGLFMVLNEEGGENVSATENSK